MRGIQEINQKKASWNPQEVCETQTGRIFTELMEDAEP